MQGDNADDDGAVWPVSFTGGNTRVWSLPWQLPLCDLGTVTALSVLQFFSALKSEAVGSLPPPTAPGTVVQTLWDGSSRWAHMAWQGPQRIRNSQSWVLARASAELAPTLAVKKLFCGDQVGCISVMGELVDSPGPSRPRVAVSLTYRSDGVPSVGPCLAAWDGWLGGDSHSPS